MRMVARTAARRVAAKAARREAQTAVSRVEMMLAATEARSGGRQVRVVAYLGGWEVSMVVQRAADRAVRRAARRAVQTAVAYRGGSAVGMVE